MISGDLDTLKSAVTRCIIRRRIESDSSVPESISPSSTHSVSTSDVEDNDVHYGDDDNVHPRSSRVQQQSGPKYKQQSTTHGITPQGFVSNFRSKAHMQRSHSEHSNTRTKTSTSYKSTHRYNMG